jgi:AcrR family transcriptional regulator
MSAEASGGIRNGDPAAPAAGRPRSGEAHRAILDATLELLQESGFSALTVEGVASRAGVGKATIYRRWPSKLPLVVEAFGQLPAFEDIDTGTLAGDLKAMLTRYLHDFLSTPLATVYPSLAAERAHNPELGQVLDPVLKSRRRPLESALQRAVARGEVSPDIDLDLAADLIVGPIAVRLFLRGMKIHPSIVDPMVDLALGGIARLRPARE